VLAVGLWSEMVSNPARGEQGSDGGHYGEGRPSADRSQSRPTDWDLDY